MQERGPVSQLFCEIILNEIWADRHAFPYFSMIAMIAMI